MININSLIASGSAAPPRSHQLIGENNSQSNKENMKVAGNMYKRVPGASSANTGNESKKSIN